MEENHKAYPIKDLPMFVTDDADKVKRKRRRKGEKTTVNAILIEWILKGKTNE